MQITSVTQAYLLSSFAYVFLIWTVKCKLHMKSFAVKTHTHTHTHTHKHTHTHTHAENTQTTTVKHILFNYIYFDGYEYVRVPFLDIIRNGLWLEYILQRKSLLYTQTILLPSCLLTYHSVPIQLSEIIRAFPLCLKYFIHFPCVLMSWQLILYWDQSWQLVLLGYQGSSYRRFWETESKIAYR